MLFYNAREKEYQEGHAAAVGDADLQQCADAVIMVDMAVHEASGTEIMLLVQSCIPGQDLHNLANKGQPSLSPWYELRPGVPFRTPELVFPGDALRRLP